MIKYSTSERLIRLKLCLLGFEDILTARHGAKRGDQKLGQRVIAGKDPQAPRPRKENENEKANDRNGGDDRWRRNG